MTRTYPQLYIFSVTDNHRYGQHCTIIKRYADKCRVEWHTDGKTGFVKFNQLKPIQAWEEEEGKAFLQALKKEKTSKYWTNETYRQISDLTKYLLWDIQAATGRYRLEREKANSFRLEMQ